MKSSVYVVLGEYYPVKPWKAWRIGRDLTQMTHYIGLVPHEDPKHGPEPHASWVDKSLHAQVRRFNLNGQGGSWHQDGDTTPGSRMDCAMVLWSNVAPTLFKSTTDNKIYQPKPYEVVLVRNLSCYHRRPDNAPYERWLFRQRIALPARIGGLD